MKDEIVRVVRVIEYEGPREWVDSTLKRSINGTLRLSFRSRITVATLGESPELPPDLEAALEKARTEELVNG